MKVKELFAVAVLGGSLVKDKNGKWRTTGFNEGDNFGVLGDRLRVVAAVILYRKQKTKIIALGGRGRLKVLPDSPAVSKIIKAELAELAVKPEDIICDVSSGGTFEQLRALANIAQKRRIDCIAIITNKYHIPRVKAMIKHHSYLKRAFSGLKLDFKSAEGILLKYEPEKWAAVIDSVYAGPVIKKRIGFEKAGVKQIKEGTYNYGN